LSVDTDLAIMRPAATEAAVLLTSILGLVAEPGEGFDLWAENTDETVSLGGEALSKGAKAWSAPLIGPLGPCGEVALALPAGARCPGKVASPQLWPAPLLRSAPPAGPTTSATCSAPTPIFCSGHGPGSRRLPYR